MADKKIEQKSDKIEREYIIPIRQGWIHVPRYKKANRAVKEVKKFLVKHMKIRDRDLRKVRVDKYLNEFIWARGIKNPPSKVKVKAVKEGDIVRVELLELPENIKYKKERAEKINKKAIEAIEKKKSTMQKAKEAMQAGKTEKTEEQKEEIKSNKTESENPEEKQKTEKKKEESEKKAAAIETTKKMEKQAAKQAKHETKVPKQPKHQQRKALNK